MNKIKLLTPETIHQIAAGEVIQRPLNIIKELLENSIDAKSNNIKLEIEEGGIKKIIITDDGCGISCSDLNLALTKHATSKITNIEDLQIIQSLGFRGEALSAIASVTNLTLESKSIDSNIGYQISTRGWRDPNQLAKKKIAMSDSTKIIITDLFYNIPARKKFLKAAYVEAQIIEKLVRQYCFIYPKINFSFYNNKKCIFNKKNNKDSLRIAMNIQFSNEHKVSIAKDQNTEVKIIYSKNTSNLENFISVNNRLIKNRLLQKYINTNLPDHNYILVINTDPKAIDFNVHPHKTEIAFTNMIQIQELISEAINKQINSQLIIKPSIANKKNIELPTYKEEKQIDYFKNNNTNTISSANTKQSSFLDQENVVNQTNQTNQTNHTKRKKIQFNDIKILCTIGKQYCLAQSEDNFIFINIIDLIAELLKHSVGILCPINITQYNLTQEEIITLQKLHFNIDKNMNINKIPFFIEQKLIKQWLQELSSLNNNLNSIKISLLNISNVNLITKSQYFKKILISQNGDNCTILDSKKFIDIFQKFNNVDIPNS